jgi:SagB-type dehydrogenase family enzyme
MIADRGVIAQEMIELIDGTCLLVEGTTVAEADDAYGKGWAWSEVAGLYHFSNKYNCYLDNEATATWLEERIRTTPSPPLFLTNEHHSPIVELPPCKTGQGLLSIMNRRRTDREFGAAPISLKQLGDCLFSGLGITGFIETTIPGLGPLPLKMTPSGGARNPYEAYVVARNVSGLSPAIYHYSAREHTLGWVAALPEASIGQILGNQAWADDAAALVILAADFSRVSWKYPHFSGYRVVLIEAGHIAQNMALTATSEDLAVAQTCAISDRLVEELLDLDPITRAAIYAVVIGSGSGRSAEGSIA